MKRFVSSVLFAAALILASCSGGREGEACKGPSSLSRDTVLIGDQVKWGLKLSLRDGEEFFIEKPEDPVAQGVETIRPWRVDTLSCNSDSIVVEGNVIITSFDSGSFFMPPLIAMVKHGEGNTDTLYCDGPTLEVRTIPVDTADFKPLDIKGQVACPMTFGELAPWIFIPLGVIALALLVIWMIRNKRRNRGLFGQLKQVEPPHIVALRNLDRINSSKLWQNDRQKQFYTEVTDTIRQYVSDVYEISAMEETSAELFDELKDKDIDSRVFESLEELFRTADYVKFAKHQASVAENEEAIPVATRFVNTTYMQRLEKEAAEKAAAEAEKDARTEKEGAE